MARVVSVANSFLSGELSPSAYGRTDIAKYAAGASCLRNYLHDPLGGIRRRMGTRFVACTKFSQWTSRVLPFEPTTAAAYMLEAGCQYVRVFKNNTTVGTENLIVNGEFGADIAGWTTATVNGTVTWSATGGGTMRLFTLAGGSSSARQSVNVTSGASYAITLQLTVTAGDARILIGSTAGGGDLAVSSNLASGTYTFTVTATTTLISVLIRQDTTPATILVDNVAVYSSTGLEVETPYNYGEVFGLETVQSGDEAYFLHECHPTRKLQRYADDCYRFNCVMWNPSPSVEFGARIDSSISAGALSGPNVTVTLFNNKGNGFLAADVDREIQITSGTNAGARAGIKTVSASDSVVVNVCVPFLTTGLNCAGTWKLAGSPRTTLSPELDVDPVGKSSVLTLSLAGWRNGNPGETDVGKMALVNGGAYEITCVSSTTVARSIIRSVQTGTTAATVKGEPGAWSLEEPIWNCHRGFASTGDFHNDRLYLNSVFRFLGSQTSDYENFATGVDDDASVNFALNSKTITTIRGIVGGKDLQLFTAGGEFIATSEGAVITPTDVLVSAETRHGSSGITPIPIGGKTTLFVDKSGRQVLEFTVPRDSISESYESPNLLLLAEHLTATRTITGWAFQRRPSPTLWCVVSDGELLSMAYRREENVVAWAKHNTCGAFESVGVASHPDGDRDQVWLIVNRTINGQTQRSVEYLDDSPLGPYDRRYTDASAAFSCTAASRLTGLSHLECAYVQVLANGAFLCNAYVVNGTVKLSDSGEVNGPFEVGLPYTSEVVTLQPEVQFGAGSIQPMAKSWKRVFVRLKDSCELLYRTGTGTWSPIRNGDSIGNGVADYNLAALGNFVDARIWIRQEKPLPSHILMIGGLLEANPD